MGDKLLIEREELYKQDLWMFTGTSGPDVKYYKQHIYSFELEDTLCGMSSRFFEVQTLAVIRVEKDEIIYKEETSSSVYMSFRTMGIPRANFCQRCAQRAKDRIADLKSLENLPKTPSTPSFPDIFKEKEVLVKMPIVPEIDEYAPGEELQVLTKDRTDLKLTQLLSRQMEKMEPHAWVQYYFSEMSVKDCNKFLLTKTHYPLAQELVADELWKEYLGVPNTSHGN